ncbi:MAG: hypothetical protein IID41_14100 [Planctomycetes bacterium]|nr:hypothetical protein [Planctomycetota bacterium]
MDVASFVLYGATIYVAGVLLISGLAKGVDLEGFARILKRQEIVPSAAIPLAARAIPVGEVTLAVLLAFGLASPFAGMAALLLFVSFFAFTAVLFSQGRGAECGCFGVVFSERIDAGALVRDVGFLMVATSQVLLSLTVSARLADLYLVTGVAFVAFMAWTVAGPATIRMLRRAVRATGRRPPAAERLEEQDVAIQRGHVGRHATPGSRSPG